MLWDKIGKKSPSVSRKSGEREKAEGGQYPVRVHPWVCFNIGHGMFNYCIYIYYETASLLLKCILSWYFLVVVFKKK